MYICIYVYNYIYIYIYTYMYIHIPHIHKDMHASAGSCCMARKDES